MLGSLAEVFVVQDISESQDLLFIGLCLKLDWLECKLLRDYVVLSYFLLLVAKVDLLHILHDLSLVKVHVSDMVHVSKGGHGLLYINPFLEYHILGLCSLPMIFVHDDSVINIPDLKGKSKVNLAVFEDKKPEIVILGWTSIEMGDVSFVKSNIVLLVILAIEYLLWVY